MQNQPLTFSGDCVPPDRANRLSSSSHVLLQRFTCVAMLSTPLRFLSVLPAELSLATVLKSGQAFRWERFDVVTVTRDETTSNGSSTTEGTEWAMGWGDRTVVLRQDGD